MRTPFVPSAVKDLDEDVVVEVLSRLGVNVSEAASELGVASGDLRRLLWANPKLTDAAAEIEERRLDLAEKNIAEALHSGDARLRIASSFFTIRNSRRAKLRGWITSSAATVDVNVSVGAKPQHVEFRWRNSRGDGETVERDGKPLQMPRYGGGAEVLEGELALPPALIEHAADPEPAPIEPAADLEPRRSSQIRRRLSLRPFVTSASGSAPGFAPALSTGRWARVSAAGAISLRAMRFTRFRTATSMRGRACIASATTSGRPRRGWR
jgi:hypothetical protein